MYCPKCAAQNMENAKYCRACGADISLVPVALTGRLPPHTPAADDESDSVPEWRRHRRRRRAKEPTYAKAFENMGVGFAFLIISVLVALYAPAGRFWWFWLLIPTFACFGEAVGQFMHMKRQLGGTSASAVAPVELPHAPLHAAELPPRNTSEMIAPPPSVTEGTTRHLGSKE